MANKKSYSFCPIKAYYKPNPYVLTAVLLAGIFFTSELTPLLSRQNNLAMAAQSQQYHYKDLQTTHARIVELEQYVRHAPNDVNQWINLGNLYFDTGMLTKAITAYKHALKLRPNAPNVLTDLGIIYRETGLYNEAVKAFTKAVRLNSNHQNALFNLGIVLYFDLHQHAEGKLIWNKLLRVNPQAMTPDGQSVASLLQSLPE